MIITLPSLNCIKLSLAGAAALVALLSGDGAVALEVVSVAAAFSVFCWPLLPHAVTKAVMAGWIIHHGQMRL